LLELEKQKNAQISSQLGPGNPRVSAETGSSIGSCDQSEEISDQIIFQGKMLSDTDKQSEMQSVSANKLFLQDKIISSQVGSIQSENEINLENKLLLDALMTDDVDVHSFITDDVVHSLSVADVYAMPQLTDSLGAQHACLPACVHISYYYSAWTATTAGDQ